VAATSTVAEFVVPPLLAAFAARTTNVEASVGVSDSGEMAALLHERLADVCFGPRLSGDRARGLTSEAMMRYGLVVVASPSHRLADTNRIQWQTLLKVD
jgi:DNA-binding transcriptional LysR family regulator